MNNPICGTKQSKLWGWTQCLYKGPLSETHRLVICSKMSRASSKHKHDHKWNRFFVTDGELTVRVWLPSGEQAFLLQEGEYLDIAPGTYHKFELHEYDDDFYSCECLEIYWIDQINSDDIDREPPINIGMGGGIITGYPSLDAAVKMDTGKWNEDKNSRPEDLGFDTFVSAST